ncbi:hypothetical protein [Sedimenticola sp.]|uniref:hypothetical protein n=1 Tax=Sedimenticola sp. TaxID=1940285 RepID=UPI003D0FC00E
MRSLLILLLALVFSGCTALPIKTAQKEKLDLSSLIKQAKVLHKQEKWQEALILLNEGVKQHPEALEVADLRAEIKRDWELKKRNQEDWILIQETRALQAKIPHLEELVRIDPQNYITKSRLLFWQTLLESKVAALIACGSVHLHLDQSLAENCVTLAEQIKPSKESEHLQKKIQQSHAAQKRTELTRQAVRIKRVTAQQRDQLFKLAHTQLDNGAIPDAIASLDQLLELVPDDAEAKMLRNQVIQLRDERVARLIDFGDKLYRDEQIEQAVSVWESAEKLDMGRQDVAARIDRAMKVLERLREIQNKP